MRHEYYIEVTLINILKMKKVLLFLSIALLVSCSDCKEDGQAGRPEVRNVIFMIGDGMGPAQVYAGLTHNGGHLTLEEFPFVGLVKTYSANRYITDSAAGGTALATGNKTNNGMIGVTPDTVAVMSSLMEAHKAGMATGIVVTSPVMCLSAGAARISRSVLTVWMFLPVCVRRDIILFIMKRNLP